MTLALVTNDDGIDSPGLAALARCAVEAGCDTVIAAPAAEASGTSAGLTAAEDDRRIAVESRKIPDLPDVPAFAVVAHPGLIALVAAHDGFGDRPDVLLSGINRGANIGRAVLHSGTVGAALTAGINGIRALAVSLDIGLDPAEHYHWDTAAALARDALGMLLELEPGTVLNLNVPNLPLDQVAPMRRAALARFGTVRSKVDRLDEGTLEIVAVSTEDEEVLPGTDVALLAAGHPTLTPLFSVAEDTGVRLPID